MEKTQEKKLKKSKQVYKQTHNSSYYEYHIVINSQLLLIVQNYLPNIYTKTKNQQKSNKA